MVMYLLNVLDKFGNRKATLNGVASNGPARGVSNLVYDAYATKVSQIGQISFSAPLAIQKNQTLQVGNIVQLVDMIQGVEGSFIITERSIQASTGSLISFTCPDLSEELRWPIYPGYVNGAAEDVGQTLDRILAWESETTWASNNTVSGFMGVPYTADKISLAQMVDKLAQERFSIWTTGPGRVINFHQIGGKSGIHLVHASRSPDAMRKPTVRPIIDIVQVEGLTSTINCICPTGAGNGFAELTLESLYNPEGETAVNIDRKQTWYVSGPINFAGFNPAYRIYRRLRQDGLGIKYEYFLCDPTSIANYRQRWLPYSQSQIAPISGSPLDLQAAAAALYQLTLSYLLWHAQPNEVYTVTADGRNGSNVGVGGKTVNVNWKKVVGGVETWTINQDLYVLGVQRTVDPQTGKKTDVFTVSTTGVNPQNTGSLITGMLQDINYWKNTPMIYPGRLLFQVTDYLDAQHPMTFTIPGDKGIIERVSATLKYTLIPIRSTATTAVGGAHTHTVPIPALSVLVPPMFIPTPSTPVPVSGVTTPVNAGPHGHPGTATSTSTSVGAADANNASLQGAMNNHYHDLFIQAGGDPGPGVNSKYLYYNPDGQSGINMVTTGGSKFARTTDVRNTVLDSTHAHGASSSSVTGVAAGGALSVGAQTPGQTTANAASSTSNNATFTTSSATTTSSLGGEHTHPLAYGIYTGSSLSLLTIAVDSTIVVYNTTVSGVVDILPYINDQNDHVITASGTGLGGVTFFLNERHRETTYSVP